MLLEEVEVEDVACTVDDMDGTDCSRTSVQREWSDEGVERGHRDRIDGRVVRPPRRRCLSACKETSTALFGQAFQRLCVLTLDST